MTDRAAILRKALADPEVQARRLSRLREVCADPQDRARRAELLLATTSTPQARAAQAAGCKASWADPETRARRLAGIRAKVLSPEGREGRAEGGRKGAAASRIAARRRAHAKALVREAGVPVLKGTVDYAVDLIKRGACPVVVVATLRRMSPTTPAQGAAA